MTKQITAKEMAAKINEIAPKALYKAEIISADKVISRELEHHATAEQVREMDRFASANGWRMGGHAGAYYKN